MNKKTKILISLILLSLLVGCYMFFQKPHNIYYTNGVNQQVGYTESIITEDSNSVVSIHYPKTNNRFLDRIIKNEINNVMNNFNTIVKDYPAVDISEKSELNIDFKTYLLNDDFVSINFDILYNLNGSKINDMININMSLSEKRNINMNDIFTGGYMNAIKSRSKIILRNTYHLNDNIIDSIIEDKHFFNDFVLTNDALIIFYNLNGEYLKINIAYDMLTKYMKTELKPLNNEYTTAYVSAKERKINPDKKMVALTFDDGPHPKYTDKILDILKKYDSYATFFVLGNRVNSYPDVTRRIVAEGNEIGNHSYNHKLFSNLTEEQIAEQVNNTNEIIFFTTGFMPSLIRVPYGIVNKKVKNCINMPIILWSVDTNDWKYSNKKRISNIALKNIDDGDIILMHDIRRSSVGAVEIIVKNLIEEGYQLVTVSDLFKYKKIELEKGETYFDTYQ